MRQPLTLPAPRARDRCRPDRLRGGPGRAPRPGWPVTLVEAGPAVGEHVRQWGHVRLFTPWSMNVSPLAQRVLGAEAPAARFGGDTVPTGDELVTHLLEPLVAAAQARGARLLTGTRVVGGGARGPREERRDRHRRPGGASAAGAAGRPGRRAGGARRRRAGHLRHLGQPQPARRRRHPRGRRAVGRAPGGPRHPLAGARPVALRRARRPARGRGLLGADRRPGPRRRRGAGHLGRPLRRAGLGRGDRRRPPGPRHPVRLRRRRCGRSGPRGRGASGAGRRGAAARSGTAAP